MVGTLDPFNVARFLDAQTRFYVKALCELRAGRKESLWMWFIFPQLRGLGRSESARYFGISSLKEAEIYLRHPILGARLREITEAVTILKKHKIEDIFPYPDDRKFHSSMTLFAIAGEETKVFDRALTKYFRCELDAATRDLLRTSRGLPLGGTKNEVVAEGGSLSGSAPDVPLSD